MHHESRCMSCLKATAMIIGRTYCFCHNIYYGHLASVRFERSVCLGSLMTT